MVIKFNCLSGVPAGMLFLELPSVGNLRIEAPPKGLTAVASHQPEHTVTGTCPNCNVECSCLFSETPAFALLVVS